jgi:hypothetical protein
MKFKTNLIVFFIVGVFLLSIISVSGKVYRISARVSPHYATATDDLDCKFRISGNEENYDVIVNWYKDGIEYINEEIDYINAENPYVNGEMSVANRAITTVTLDSSETAEGEKWICTVQAGTKTVSKYAKIKNKVKKARKYCRNKFISKYNYYRNKFRAKYTTY